MFPALIITSQLVVQILDTKVRVLELSPSLAPASLQLKLEIYSSINLYRHRRRGCSSVGRAFALHVKGLEFKSRLLQILFSRFQFFNSLSSLSYKIIKLLGGAHLGLYVSAKSFL